MQFLFLILVLAVLLLVWNSRSNTLFVFEVRNGKLRKTRGNAPAGLVSDFQAAVRHIDCCTIKGQKSSRDIRLSFGGNIDEGTAQRLKNILGLHHS